MKANALEVSCSGVRSVADEALPKLAGKLRAVAGEMSGLNASLRFLEASQHRSGSKWSCARV